jgi:HAD superfamily hydrolase (TIGR01509 family)
VDYLIEELEMIKGVIFDMDGLMFDTERISISAWKYAALQMGHTLPDDFFFKILGTNMKTTMNVYESEFGNAFDFQSFKELRRGYTAKYIEENGMPIKDGLIELLDYLKTNGFKITVATSTDKEKALYNFEKANISGYFGEIVCGDMIKRGKPEPDIYLKALEILSLSSTECLALEDSPVGILSAYRAGLKPVMIPDLVEPDEETSNLLYAKLPSLLYVVDLLKGIV